MAEDSCEHLLKIAVLESQLAGVKENIALQAREYERRLSELNHSHQQQMDRNAAYISRETWDLRNLELDKWRREIDQWRWISIGGGVVGGGLIALLMKLIEVTK